MPWTFAHPAAVLPLLKLTGPRRLSFAALVIGSMSPDFGYYVGQFDMAGVAHTPWGLLWICLPAGLAVLGLARWLRVPVARLLPQPHAQVLLAARPPPLSVLTLILAAVSVLLGAATHAAWDACTHGGHFFVQEFEVLRLPLFTAAGHEFRVFGVLQHASTAVGSALLGWAYWRHARAFGAFRPVAAEDRRRYAVLAGMALVAAVCAVPLALADAGRALPEFWGYLLVVRELIYATTGFFLLLTIAALMPRSSPPAAPVPPAGHRTP